ncbi:PTS system sucrose-specific IIC component [Weissella uvarum]|uniref:PTS beta-glucoside transporter subunit IIBCA n=1 Tax=Weissella uvarum TaxID=1479233 RepID=UPI001960192A|nr:PTS beta-glucoside transporter subunit IIBCA [Weissella uvarum]MBM7616720.1 PTS system sucrose-specific IIC component [Weissella uvarum]MCM0594825.1 PTS glucose transporter subunit IIA [Weissella uvarum]
MAKDYTNEAKQLIDLIGADNVISVTHCQTRLRFVLKDRKQVDDKKIEALPDVKGVFDGSGQYQVIIGTGTVNKVYEAIENLNVVNTIYGKDDNEDEPETAENQGWVKRLMAMLSGIFVPIVPVIAATGLFLGLKSMLFNENVLALIGASTSDIPQTVQQLTSVLTDTVFAFLPALIVWSTFRYFKGTPIIGMVIGLMLVSPILPNAYAVADGSAKALELFGVIPVVGAQGSVLTAMVAGIIGAKLELFFRKHMPDVIEQIFTPFFTMLVTFAIMILGVGPIMHMIELQMVSGVEAVIHIPFGIGGFIIGALYPLMVLLGVHHTMIMVETSLLANTGFNPLITLEAMYGFANLGVALAMMLRARNDNAKANATGGFMSQIFGVSEPTLFGVLIRYNLKPLLVTVFTSGLGAAVLSIFKVKANTYGLAVLPSYLMYIYNGRMLIIYFIVSIATIAVAFVLTNLFAMPKEVLAADDADERSDAPKNVLVQTDVKDNSLYAPVAGNIVPLDEVPDPVFSSGMMGKGLAIEPTDAGKINILAPQNGQVSLVADTGHAYGLVTEDGMEILVHIGIDTVNLKGKGFETLVKSNQTVKAGDVLGTVNLDQVKDEGLNSDILILVTNSDAYDDIERTQDTPVAAQDIILTVQRTVYEENAQSSSI